MVGRQRAAFTIVELLVVVAILGLLVALLLPAIQSARHAAWQTRCRSNLRQVGLALTMYHDTHGTLPPGWVVGVDDNGIHADRTPGWSWSSLILNHLEQSPLCNQAVRFDETIDSPIHDKARIARIPIYRCPADPFEPTHLAQSPATTSSGLATMASRTLLAQGVFFACASCGSPSPIPIPLDPTPDAPTPDAPSPEAPTSPETPTPTGATVSMAQLGTSNYVGCFGTVPLDEAAAQGGSALVGDGVFYENSRTRFRDITDGLSQTILVGERSSLLGGATWVGVLGSELPAVARVVGVARSTPNPSEGDSCAFGSLHPGTTHFLLGDGAVVSISDAIDPAVFRALATRSGDEPTSGWVD